MMMPKDIDHYARIYSQLRKKTKLKKMVLRRGRYIALLRAIYSMTFPRILKMFEGYQPQLYRSSTLTMRRFKRLPSQEIPEQEECKNGKESSV